MYYLDADDSTFLFSLQLTQIGLSPSPVKLKSLVKITKNLQLAEPATHSLSSYHLTSRWYMALMISSPLDFYSTTHY